MSGSALILAAHGSRDDSSANARVRHYADAMADLGWFDEVAVTFRLGEPTFSAVLDSLVADDITVVPVMTSAGYYSDVVLRRELTTNARFGQLRIRQTPPVGAHPDIVRICQRRIGMVLQQFNLHANNTALVVVGHGTKRHQRSRSTTLDLAAALRQEKVCAEVLPAFLDECPLLENVYGRLTQRHVLVVPFLIGGGYHVTADIPARLRLNLPRDGSPPYAGYVGSRLVVCDMAVGVYPEIANVIASLARRYAPSQRKLDTQEIVQ